jgi:hypothetical protein
MNRISGAYFRADFELPLLAVVNVEVEPVAGGLPPRPIRKHTPSQDALYGRTAGESVSNGSSIHLVRSSH